MHGSGGKTSLFYEFSAAARGRILDRVDEPGRKFPSKALSAGRYCRTMGKRLSGSADRDIILLADRMVDFAMRPERIRPRAR